MTGYSITSYPDDSVVVMSINQDWNTAADLVRCLNDAHAALDAQPHPVYYIVDMRSIGTVSLDDVVLGFNQGARGSNAVMKHPNIRKMIVVSDSKVLQMAAKGMNSAAFGHVNVNVFNSLDAALEAIRAGQLG